MSDTRALSGTLNGIRARNASSSCFSLTQLITAGTSSRASTRFSATVIAGTNVKCWYTMPRPSVGVLRIGDRLLTAADQHLALGRVVVTHDAFDQRALAGAVFAEQRVERSGAYFQFD